MKLKDTLRKIETRQGVIVKIYNGENYIGFVEPGSRGRYMRGDEIPPEVLDCYMDDEVEEVSICIKLK